LADDRVPEAVGLGLVVGGDLERERLVRLERGPAVEAEAGNAEHGELDREHVALFAGREVARRFHHAADRAVGKGLGVEARRLEGGAVVPEADRVLGCHG
jgi:hypothetical protein